MVGSRNLEQQQAWGELFSYGFAPRLGYGGSCHASQYFGAVTERDCGLGQVFIQFSKPVCHCARHFGDRRFYDMSHYSCFRPRKD